MGISNPLAMGLLGNTYRFSIYRNQKQEFYFVFHNTVGNTEPICWSEGYSTRQGCENAIKLVQSGASGASVL